jgi:hypothetical protein
MAEHHSHPLSKFDSCWVGGGSPLKISQTVEFIDSRAPLTPGQPEQREYRVQGMENNARVGATSAIASAVTVP